MLTQGSYLDPIRHVDGGVVKNEQGEVVTVGFLINQALLANDEGATADEKLKRFSLALRLAEEADSASGMNLSPEEVVLIKTLGGRYLTTLAYGRLEQALREEGKCGD